MSTLYTVLFQHFWECGHGAEDIYIYIYKSQDNVGASSQSSADSPQSKGPNQGLLTLSLLAFYYL